jgi:hypothetical protein
MYDKYNKATPFTVNAAIPSHKGILLTSASNTTASVYFFNSAGGTFGATIQFGGAPGFAILPVEVERITALGGGTGFLLN